MLFAAPTSPVEIKRVRVRLINTDERAQWDALMRTHHYLGFVALVGRSLRYVAEIDGHWLALLGWASAALKVASRDDWIGWSPTLQWQRLALIANNSRFLILPGQRVKNLASRILGLNLACLSQDWLRVHGHPLILEETRRIWSSELLNDYVNFPYAKQVACVEREVFEVSKNTTRIERVYLISSQTRAQADPAQLLRLNRGHWGIENRLHYVRDMA